MKRFITVSAKHAEEVLILIRNAAAGAAGVEMYQWIKQNLQRKSVPHNDQTASHQNELPQKGGFTSFYLDNNGQWMKVNH